MNACKSNAFMQSFENDEIALKRKLTEFSLQLIPNKFPHIINYKKILMENLTPDDFEVEIMSTDAEIFSLVTDSKIKSLYLKKASEQIKILEHSMKEPNEELENIAKNELSDFISSLNVSTKAFGTSVSFKKDYDTTKVVINDTEINGLCVKNCHEFDVLTFNEGFTHTFTIRLEFANGNILALYSSVGRDGVKGEKPKVYACALINGYYVTQNTDFKVY